MNTTNDLGSAIDGLIDLLAYKTPEIAIVPEKVNGMERASKTVNSLFIAKLQTFTIKAMRRL
jgi:hypothetical protein